LAAQTTIAITISAAATIAMTASVDIFSSLVAAYTALLP
jgi:hypothetical protein